MLFPPLDKRNICDKAQGLRITSEGYIGELSWACDALALSIEDWTPRNSLIYRKVFAREENTPVYGDVSCPQRSESQPVLVTKRSSTGHASDQ